MPRPLYCNYYHAKHDNPSNKKLKNLTACMRPFGPWLVTAGMLERANDLAKLTEAVSSLQPSIASVYSNNSGQGLLTLNNDNAGRPASSDVSAWLDKTEVLRNRKILSATKNVFDDNDGTMLPLPPKAAWQYVGANLATNESLKGFCSDNAAVFNTAASDATVGQLVKSQYKLSSHQASNIIQWQKAFASQASLHIKTIH